MATETPQQGESGSEWNRSMGGSSNVTLAGPQQHHGHLLAHWEAANAASNSMTQDAHLKLIHKTGSSKNNKQHAIGCEYGHIAETSCQPTITCTVHICREVHDQLIAAHNRYHASSTNIVVCTVCEIKRYDDVSSGIFANEFHEKRPREWTNNDPVSLEEATEVYMVQVLAEFHF